MQESKRLRIFAGPNGSGKSTLYNDFKLKYNPGFLVNADDIERELRVYGLIDLNNFGLNSNEKALQKFNTTKEAKSLFTKSKEDNYSIEVKIVDNFIVTKSKITHSYEASFVASYLRWLFYLNNKSFSFETVMSHPSKIEELKKAQKKGYKTYLYFVCTDSPEINIDRVSNRVNKGGHRVNLKKIISRYKQTLENLPYAIKYSSRVYLFDNSGKEIKLIAEIFEGNMQLKYFNPPNWFLYYVLPDFI